MSTTTLEFALVSEDVESCASQPATALVVDDAPVDRRIAGGMVARIAGLQVAYAGDGKEALAAVRRDPPLVVLTDLQPVPVDDMVEQQGRGRRL